MVEKYEEVKSFHLITKLQRTDEPESWDLLYDFGIHPSKFLQRSLACSSEQEGRILSLFFKLVSKKLLTNSINV